MRYAVIALLLAAGTAFLAASRAERKSLDVPLFSKRGKIVIGLTLIIAGVFWAGLVLLRT